MDKKPKSAKNATKLEQQYHSRLEKIIRNVFGKTEIVKIKWFGRGYSSVVFDVELRNPTTKIVVKIVEKEYSTDSREKERRVWDLLKERYPGFPVPKVYAIDTSKTLADKSYTVTERIEGKTMSQVWEIIPNKEEVFQEVGKFAGMIHSISFAKYGNLDPRLEITDTFTDWQKKYDKNVKKTIDLIRKRDYVGEKFAKRQADFWSKNRKLMQSETKPVLCWGDIGMGNIIVKNMKDGSFTISGLIDFEFAHSGGAVHDIFSRVRAFKHHYDNRERIFSGHKKYSTLPENYAELALMYHLLACLSELSKVPGMSWHGLDEDEAQQRKTIIVENNINRVNGVMKKFT